MHRTLVIGATGNIGSQVVSQLAAKGAPVRAMTRDPQTARFPAGVEAIRGDLSAPESLDACLDGIDAVFLVFTAPGDVAAPALERIAKRTRRIVYLSAPIKTPHPFFQQPNPMRVVVENIERLIESSELEWTFLRPGMLASNARLWWSHQIRSGNVVRWPYPDAATAPTCESDIAAVAVRALCEDGHHKAEYVLTGPESLTQAEQVTAIGRAIGRSLSVEELSPDEARRELRYLGPEFIVNMLLNAWGAARGLPAFVTSTIEELTGTPARTFFEWATENAAEFGGEGAASA
jgi:uncharacterized protein YbjT (DUF2867 family)